MESIKRFIMDHPQWTSWAVLSVGMVIILVWSARDVGLLFGQWVALIIATVAVAGLAVWIIGWEDEEAVDAFEEEQSVSLDLDEAPEEKG
jgi:MFS superfamily sulfate permease-like transporter